MSISINLVQNLPPLLPSLRADIVIQSGGMDFNHTPTWVIQDPVNNTFFHIGWKEHELLSRWRPVAPQFLLQELKENSLAEITEADLLGLLVFLSQHCLIDQSFSAMQHAKKRLGPKETKGFKWLIEHYLFFRIPLFKPDAFLTRTYPQISWIFSRTFVFTVFVLAFLGLVLLSYSWTDYVSTFFDLFNFESLLLYGVSLLIIKVFHELGHAYACKKYGLQVPTMGLAFLVMTPLLYTDTTESWKIKDPHKRIQIALAGVWVEFCLAVLAMWLWLIFEPGILRSIFFFMSSVSLATTLLVNISPFLRFDGYHVLSDLMGMRNLQTRSFALMRWRIREAIFGWHEAPPEQFIRRKRIVLYLYAALAWIYRFMLFIGIAFLVYHFFFKLLGLILFVVEMMYFIIRPIFQEISLWWKMRTQIRRNRHTDRSLVLLGLLLAFFILPWPNAIYLPATVAPFQKKYFLTEPSQVKKVLIKQGEFVRKDQVLITLNNPKMDVDIAMTEYEIRRVEFELRNILTAVNNPSLSKKGVTVAELHNAKAKLAGLLERRKELTIVAPFEGQIASLAKGLKPGMWIEENQALFIEIDPKKWMVNAYIKGSELSLLEEGIRGRFIPDDPTQATLDVIIEHISEQPTKALLSFDPDHRLTTYLEEGVPESAYHASTLGGKIAVRKGEQESYVPEIGIYQVTAIPNADSHSIDRVSRGLVRVVVSHFFWFRDWMSRVVTESLQEVNF